MKKSILIAILIVFATTAIPTYADPPPWASSRGHHHDRYRDTDRHYGRDHERPPSRGYRLGRNDHIWREPDGRYHCRRSDGTTGLVIGAALGGLLGNSLADGDTKTLGTLLGMVGGGLLGKSIGRRDLRCR